VSQSRQLAAIMFTDIEGYSATMQRDEQKALALKDRHREILQKEHRQYNGRIIQYYGDGTLSVFQSVVEAVQCALAMQQAFVREPRVPVRIGLHVGDIMFSDEQIFGDSVNLASRIESLGVTGSVLISDKVNAELSNHPEFKTVSAGVYQFKNIDLEVEVFALDHEELVKPPPGSLQGKTVENKRSSSGVLKKFPGKSIAVLPFVNISNDPEQEYFSDGLTEEIITDLSQIEELRVISRGSAMAFKGSKKKTREIAIEIGVHYVLEGSVRKSGNDLRIVAQLINAEEDVHVWAEKYSGKLDDIFSIQEQVSRSIVAALKIKLSKSELEKLAFKPIKNSQAYELYQKAQYEVYRFKEDGLKRAIEYLDDALKTEGENALIYSKKGIAYCILFTVATKPETDYLEKARFCASRVFDLEPGNSQGHVILGWITFYDGNSKDAVTHIKRAYKADPNDPDTLLLLILGNFYLGLSEEADQAAFQMGNVDPLNPVYYALLSLCSFTRGDIDNAFKNIRKGYEIYPEIPQVQLYYAYFLTCTERLDEAKLIVDRYISETAGSIFQAMGLLFKSALNKTNPGNILNVELENKLKMDVEWTWLIADFYSLMGKTEDAIFWLEHAVSKGFINYPLLYRYDPFLKNIQGEKKFERLMNQVKTEWEKVKVKEIA
jgi:adenylate cyclase